MHPAIEQLRTLTKAEKLQIVEELWDDLAESDGDFPFPSWHRDELERRAASLAADPSLAITREELWKRVDARNG